MDINTVYGAFVDYFGDIQLKRTKQENGYDIYTCKTRSGLLYTHYIYVITQTKPYNKEYMTLNSLDWVCLQTRKTEEYLSVPDNTYLIDEHKKQALPDILTVKDRQKEFSSYLAPLPINIKLLHDPKRKTIYQYPDSIKLYQAIETYDCIIELL
jgi:hypothetical protein